MTKNIGIIGDGTAIGNGNTVIVDKSRTTHHHGHRGGRSGGSRGGTGNGEALIGAAFMVILALIGASYLFALHADQFYMVALMVAGVQVWLSVSSVVITFWTGQSIEWRSVTTAGLTVAAMSIIGFGWSTYPSELARLAQAAATSRIFWCGLSDYGHAVALKHFLGATVISVGLFLLLPHSLAAACQHFATEGSFIDRLTYRFSPTSTLVVAAIALATAFFLLDFAGPYIASESARLAPMICPGGTR